MSTFLHAVASSYNIPVALGTFFVYAHLFLDVYMRESLGRISCFLGHLSHHLSLKKGAAGEKVQVGESVVHTFI